MTLAKYLKYAGLAVLLASGAAHAADCTSSQTAAMTACAADEFKKADAQLNQSYNDYRARLSPVQKGQLKDAQLAWVKFRDLTCDFESSGVEGGSAYPMIRFYCLAEKTGVRLKEIQALKNCEEGDLSCPMPKTK